MAGFAIDPSVLAQLAASGFRPPQAPTMPGLSLSPHLLSPQQSTPAVSLRDGLSTLVAGIKALGGLDDELSRLASLTAGPSPLAFAGPCAVSANARGAMRPPRKPTAAATAMTSGKGASAAKSARNAATAIAHSHALCSARDPIRHAAARTTATTAGFTP